MIEFLRDSDTDCPIGIGADLSAYFENIDASSDESGVRALAVAFIAARETVVQFWESEP